MSHRDNRRALFESDGVVILCVVVGLFIGISHFFQCNSD